MLNSNSQPGHQYNSFEHSCQNCYCWEFCSHGKNRPDTLKGDYGLYGCTRHQLNKKNYEEDKAQQGR